MDLRAAVVGDRGRHKLMRPSEAGVINPGYSNLRNRGVVRFSNAHDGPIVKEHFHLAYIVRAARTAAVELCHDGVHAARIVAEHSADRAVTMRSRVGTED